MILLLLAAVATTPTAAEARFAACVTLSEHDPAKALAEAGSWQTTGGGVLAQQCAGVAYAAQKRWLPAAAAFEQAAREAERSRDGRAARLWVQSGNAALAAGDFARARSALDTAIIGGQLTGAEAGEAYLDRARACVALGAPAPARADIDKALQLTPADPLAWLLSATLARRQNDLSRATKDIEEASRRSPDDASVALEAGNIAVLSGSDAAARAAWQAAVKASPDSPAGKAAAASLLRLGASPAAK
jgi:tetratricopeptide (TPR) repeat protein